MGICASCESTAVAPAATAKVVLASGELREFDRPVTASEAIPTDADLFVCDADEMEFDGFVTAVGADEELRLGQLYFVLPRSMLKHPLHAEDVAALAFKASAALAAAGGRRSPVVFASVEEAAGATVGSGGNLARPVGERRRRRKKAGDGGRKYAPDLSAIPE